MAEQQKTSVLLGTPENWHGLARHDPSTRLEVYRSAILALTVRSIGEGSQLTVKSASNGTPVFVKKAERE